MARTGLTIGGYALAVLISLLWLAQTKGQRNSQLEKSYRTPTGGLPAVPPAGAKDAHDAILLAKEQEINELRALLASQERRPENRSGAGASEKPFIMEGPLFEPDGDGKLRLKETSRLELRLSKEQASALEASTQVYHDMYVEEQRRHLSIEKQDQTELAFTIAPFPEAGRQIRESLRGLWLGYIDQRTFAQIETRITDLFGGESGSFGNCRVEVKARREPKGASTILETRFSPSGEKLGGSSVCLTDFEPSKPVTDLAYQYSYLFR